MRAYLAPSMLLFALCACGRAPAPEATRPAPTGRPDKATLYGDASLLPTRAGERAREELAITAQIWGALEQLGLEPKQIEVELEPQPRVVAIVRLPASAERAAQRDAVTELCLALVPRLEPADLHLWLRADADASVAARDEAPEPRTGPSPWLLGLVCIGLGLSLGVTLERGRVLLRLRRR